MIRALLALTCLVSALALGLDAGARRADAPDPGQQIYELGLLPGGDPVRATTQGDVPLAGVACASCHRKSGFGESEGGVYVPAITGPTLFAPRTHDRASDFRALYQDGSARAVRAPRLRPAYTADTLIRAIREGVDPTGRALDPLMPRFQLDDADADALAGWLTDLSAAPDPGVDETTIRFATVVTEGVDPAARDAMLDLIDAYVERRNLDTAGLQARAGFSLWYKDDLARSFREWSLGVWTLTGPPSRWPAQLERYYAERPVFAVVSGISDRGWDPVHAFCERRDVPCLFPNTALPGPAGDHSLYLSPGLGGEARALAAWLLRSESPPERALQIYRPDDEGRALAAGFAAALGERGVEAVDRPIRSDRSLARALRDAGDFDAIALWLEDDDLSALGWPSSPPNARLLVSGRQHPDRPPALPTALAGRVWMSWPWALPGRAPPRIHRGRAWMRSRGLDLTHERLQLDTWFALSVTDHALRHLVDDFHRDYLIERVEHETENALSPGVYPRLSLGPGQRYASRGSYVIRLGAADPPEWINP